MRVFLGDLSLIVKRGEPFRLDFPGCKVEQMKLVTFFSVEAKKLVWPCELLRAIKLDCAVCAVYPIKLVMNFVSLKHLS